MKLTIERRVERDEGPPGSLFVTSATMAAAAFAMSGSLATAWRAPLRSNVLVEMELIRARPDGRYVLGRYNRLDELVRDRFLELKAVEKVMVAVSGSKSKTQ